MVQVPASVLLCGARYGVTYLPGILADRRFSLVGVLGRGGADSVALAGALGVPAFSRVAELPANMDLACVAIGGSAGETVCTALLERGVHVLFEPPVRPAYLADALTLAEARGLTLHVASHVPALQAPRAFAHALAARVAEEAPLLFRARTTGRNLHGLLDLLFACTAGRGELGEAYHCTVIDAHSLMLTNTHGATRICIEIGRGSIADDGSTATQLTLEAVFANGILSLHSPAGPVTFCPTWKSLAAGHGLAPMWQMVTSEAPTFDDFCAQRAQANHASVLALQHASETRVSAQAEHALLVSRHLALAVAAIRGVAP